MARPITWQDVSAPRFGASIEAFGDAGDRLAKAVGGIGETALDWRNTNIKDATSQAVADIATSEDPTSVAAALPKDWTIDPLAVAVAANARETQLDQKNLTNLNMQKTQAELDDRVAAREAEDIALTYRDAATSGKPLDIDRTDPRWKTAAGKLALDRIDGWARDYQDTQFKRETLNLQRAAGRRAADDDARRLKLDNALGKIVELSGSPEWADKTGEERDRLIGDVFKSFDVSMSNLDLGHKAYDLGFQGNLATPGELNKVDEATGLSGKDLINFQTTKVQGAERALNQWKARNTHLLRLGQLDATNPYEKMDDTTFANQFLKDNPEVTEGWGPDWGSEDVTQRVNSIQNSADKMGMPITRAQARLLVGKTKGFFKLGDTSVGLSADMRRDIEYFHALKARGGWEQVAADENNQLAQLELAKRDALRANATINATVRQNKSFSPSLVREYKDSPVVKRQEAEAELAAIELALQNADVLSSNELASLRKRKDKASATIAKLINDADKAAEAFENE